MRKFDAKTKNYEFHILVELMKGGDMDKYLAEFGPSFLIEN